MNVKKVLSVAALSAMLVPAMTGCNKVVAGGESVIQVRVYSGGYGTEFLHEVADKFHQAFPEYTVKFEEESSLVTQNALNEMLTPNKNEIDIYFTNGTHVSELINKSKSVLKTTKETLLEPLNDVFNSKAIGYNGKEESKTIKERMFDGYEEAMTYNGIERRWHGNMYALPWADGTTGLFYNPTVLSKYGIEEPLTSNELAAAIKEIASHTKDDHIYPYSWAGQNAPGYWLYLFETWFGQYAGLEEFNNFVKCDPGDGDIEFNGYKVYQNQGLLKSLEAMYEILDINYSSNGSISKSHMEAQNEFVRAKSGFIIDGEWLEHEMSKDYGEEVKNIKMLPVPILSCLGEANGLTDAQLHNIVKAIDEGKTDAEIKSIVSNATDAAIAKIRDARSIHNGIGVGHCIEVPSSSDCKEGVKKFLRFFFSEDSCRTFRNVAKGAMPLDYEIKDGDLHTPFRDSVDKILRTGKPQMVSSDSKLNDVRAVSQMYVFNVSAWVHPTTFSAIMQHKETLTPEKVFNDEKDYMESHWGSYMSYVF